MVKQCQLFISVLGVSNIYIALYREYSALQIKYKHIYTMTNTENIYRKKGIKKHKYEKALKL